MKFTDREGHFIKDGEHNGSSFVEISDIFVMQEDFFLNWDTGHSW